MNSDFLYGIGREVNNIRTRMVKAVAVEPTCKAEPVAHMLDLFLVTVGFDLGHCRKSRTGLSHR
jgi:hypothetical protein